MKAKVFIVKIILPRRREQIWNVYLSEQSALKAMDKLKAKKKVSSKFIILEYEVKP